MAVLAVQTIAAPSTVVTPVAAAAADSFPAVAGKTWLEVTNASGVSTTVTVDSEAPVPVGTSQTDRSVTVAAGVTRRIPIEDVNWIDASGSVDITTSPTTSITLAVCRLP